jgi:hypothetical protein
MSFVRNVAAGEADRDHLFVIAILRQKGTNQQSRCQTNNPCQLVGHGWL